MGFQIYWLKAGCFFCYYLFNFVSGGAASLSLLIRSCQRRKLGSDDDVVVVYSFSRVWLFVAPWTAALQASLSLTISQSLSKFMSIASVMLSSHLIFWCPLLLQPSIFPSIRDFSNKSDVHTKAWKWKVKVKSLSHAPLLATSWTAAYQAPPPMGFSRQEYWSGVSLPSLGSPW